MTVKILLFALLMAGFVLVEPPDRTRFWDGLFDLGHVLLFAAIMWMALISTDTFRPRSSRLTRAGWALCLTLVVAALSEISQQFQPSRVPSFGDFLRDASGACAVALLWLSRPGSADAGRRAIWPLRVAALITVLLALAPFALTLRAYVERERMLPVLARFDGSRWESLFVSTRNADLVPRMATAPPTVPPPLLRLHAGSYPALIVDEPYPDWRRYTELSLEVRSDAVTPLPLSIRVNDRWYNQRFDDAFHRETQVMRGLTSIRISLRDVRAAPRHRAMDMEHIRTLLVYAVHLDQPADLHIDHLMLR